MMADEKISPGDMAQEGPPGDGANICQQCGGTGEFEGWECPNCGGTGEVIDGTGA
jgi:rubrerythrin